MKLYKDFLKNNLLILTGQLLINLKAIVLIPVLVKSVGVTVYGGYILLMSIMSFVFGISSFGVGFRRSRFLPSANDWQTRQGLFYPQFSFQLISLTVLSLLLLLFSPFFERAFFKGEVTFAIWIVIPYLISYLLYSQSTDYFRYTHRMNYFNYATVLYPYINIAIILLIYNIFHTLTVNILFSVEILSSLLVALPLLIKMGREIGLRFLLPNVENLIADFKLGFPLVLGFIVDIILSSSDRYIIAAIISVTAVGYYTPAYAIGSILAFFPKVSCVVLPPLMSKAVDSGKEEDAGIMLNYTVEGFFLLAIPFIIGSYILSKPLLNLMANREVAQNAYLVTPVVALGTLFYGLNLILSNILFVRMRTAVMFNMNVLAALINLVFNLVLLYFFKNILIAAVTTLLSYAIAFVYIRRAVASEWHVNFPLKTITKSMIASLIMGAFLLVINIQLGENTYKLTYVIVEIVVGIVIYSITLLALKTFSYKEFSYLKKVFS